MRRCVHVGKRRSIIAVQATLGEDKVISTAAVDSGGWVVVCGLDELNSRGFEPIVRKLRNWPVSLLQDLSVAHLENVRINSVHGEEMVDVNVLLLTIADRPTD